MIFYILAQGKRKGYFLKFEDALMSTRNLTDLSQPYLLVSPSYPIVAYSCSGQEPCQGLTNCLQSSIKQKIRSTKYRQWTCSVWRTSLKLGVVCWRKGATTPGTRQCYKWRVKLCRGTSCWLMVPVVDSPWAWQGKGMGCAWPGHSTTWKLVKTAGQPTQTLVVIKPGREKGPNYYLK
jgi:hypothetical protein